MFLSWAMRAASTASREAISASSSARLRSISRLRTLFSEAMRSALTASSWAMRALAVASRAAMSACSTVLRAIDLAALRVLVLGDAHLGQDALLGDPGLLDQLAGGDLGLLDGALALDLALADFPLGGDAGLADGLLVGDPGLLDLLARGDLGALGLRVAQGTLARQLGPLDGAADLDVALLVEAGGLALALDVEGLLLGLEVARADADHRVLLDVVPELAAVLDLADQLGQTFGVEAVRRIEELQVGLVEVGQRHGLELEAVLRQRLGGGGLDALQVDAALLVHLHHGHLGGDRAQRRDELAGQQRVQPLLLHGAPAQRRGGQRDRVPRRRDAHVEVGVDVDAHAVLGDERIVLGAGHAHLQHVHVDRRDVVDDRQHEGAAVDHHPLAHETGADERHLLGGSPVEPVDKVDDDRDRDDRHDQPQDDGPDQLCSHVLTPLVRGPPPGPVQPFPSSPSLTSNGLELPRLLGERHLGGQALH